MRERPQDPERLVAVLVPVAPRTPVDALAEALAEPRGGGEGVQHARAEDDFARGVLGAGAVRTAEEGGCVCNVDGGDGDDGVLDEGSRGVV